MVSNINDLKRMKDESLSDFTNRINYMEPLVVGQAFFRSVNYDASRHVFSVFIVWNSVNDMLLDAMPNGGFQIHCSENDAMQLCKCFMGVDVFAKLRAVGADLFFKDIYVNFEGKRFVVKFTGAKTIAPEFIPRIEDTTVEDGLADEAMAKNGAVLCATGSYNRGSFNIGSFNVGSFNVGSFDVSSFNVGSYSIGSFNIGSFNVGSFNAGSFNLGSFNVGSFNLGSFSIGSFDVYSFINGSFTLGLGYIHGYAYGSYNLDSSAMMQSMPYYDFLEEIFGVGFLGYGLDNL